MKPFRHTTLLAVLLLSAFAVARAATGTNASTVTWTTTTASISPVDKLTLAVTVASNVASVTTTPSGTVTFTDLTSNASLGVASLTGGVASYTLQPATLAAGVHAIQASYSGDSTFLASTAVYTVTVTAKIPTTTLVTANQSTVAPDASVTLTATITPSGQSTSETFPGGTVQFYSGTTLIGSATAAQFQVSDVAVASLSIADNAALTDGANSITAIYLGDAYYATSTSAVMVLTIEDISIAASPQNPVANLNIVKGNSGTAAYVITGLGGYASKVQVICTVASTDYIKCSPSPQVLTPPDVASFSIQTFSSGSASTTAANRVLPRALGGSALALLGFFLLPAGRRARRWLVHVGGERSRSVVVLLLLLASLSAASVGCSSSSTPGGSGTALGVATLKITATAWVNNTVVAHDAYLSVNVTAQ